MDKVLQIPKRSWINQEPVVIREFVESSRNRLKKISDGKESDNAIESLQSSLNHLAHCDPSESIDAALDAALNQSKPQAVPSSTKGMALASSIKSQDEAVISIRFLKSKVSLSKANRPTSSIQPEYEVEVLSSQLLTDLRSAIRCENSATLHYSAEKSVVSQKSGFFFIENTFYNDTSEESVDYSRVILEWVKNSKTGIDQMQSAPLENVKFNDLTIRLGYPYLYRHMGDCEHLLVFQWLRMWNALIDHNTYSSYPRVNWTRSRFQKKCEFCSVNAAKCQVLGHPDLPSNCVLLCQECQHLFCQNNEAQATIEAYLDRSVLFS